MLICEWRSVTKYVLRTFTIEKALTLLYATFPNTVLDILPKEYLLFSSGSHI